MKKLQIKNKIKKHKDGVQVQFKNSRTQRKVPTPKKFACVTDYNADCIYVYLYV